MVKIKQESVVVNRLNSDMIIVDCHCDTIVEIAQGKGTLSEKSLKGHISLQFFALYIDTRYKPLGALERTLELTDVFYRQLNENSDKIALVRNYGDIRKTFEEGRMGAFLTVEGGEGIQERLYLLRTFYRLGIRGITLTWNQRNAIADGAFENPQGGLSNFGLEVVKEMNRLGMLIDVSHMNRQGFLDVVNNSAKPVIASHSNARALCDHPRNLDDEQLKLLAEKGGLVGVTFVPDFLVPPGKSATIETVADHIDYIKDLIGIDHIGIGSDFDGTESLPEGLEDVTKVPDLVKLLDRRGYTENQIEKVMGGNILKLLEKVMK